MSDRQGYFPIQKLSENHILFKIYIQTRSKYMYLALKISGDRGKIVVRLMINYLSSNTLYIGIDEGSLCAWMVCSGRKLLAKRQQHVCVYVVGLH